MRSGDLTCWVQIERREGGVDEAGQPIDTWVLVVETWASPMNETGMGAIRSSLQGNVPASIARYSFLMPFETVQAYGIDAGMRIVHDGMTFEIKGVTRDLQHRDRAYILTEQGGNDG